MNDAQNCAGYLVVMNVHVDDDPLNKTNITFLSSKAPKPLPCNNHLLNGWGPPQHQDGSCCDEGARFVTQIGFMGGFDIIPGINPGGELVPGTGGDEEYNIQCAPYIDNLKATLCDPQQGRYIREDPTNNRTVFRICKSSCDLVYTQCEYLLPESNLTSDITNGTEFCLASWGGFDSDPCTISDIYDNLKGFPCETNLQVLVVEDDCLSIIMPSADDVASYRFLGYPMDACAVPTAISDTEMGVLIGVSVAIGLTVVLVLFLFAGMRRRLWEEEFSDNIQ